MKKTLLIQCGVCILIILISAIIPYIKNDNVQTIVSNINSCISTNITKDEFSEFCSLSFDRIKETPAVVVQHIVSLDKNLNE